MTGGSGVFWLGSSDADIARARALLKKLSEPGVLDELGFLVLLGAFSNRLYPALNTIMTRARYLVFVPAILRHIENRRLAGRRGAETVARDLQHKLSQALAANAPDEDGIIGRRTGRDVARPPANVYWTSLADLGIATARISESAYYEQLTSGRTDAGHITDDDGSHHEVEVDEFWDSEFRTPGVLSADGSFPEGTSFHLTRREANQLRERFERLDRLRLGGGTSLLSHLLSWGAQDPDLELDFDAPWAIPDLPADLATIVEHARLLSLLAGGARLQYHALLFEKRKIADTGTQPLFEEWWEHAQDDLKAWDLGAFRGLTIVAKGEDTLFIEDWRDAICRCRSSGKAYRDADARELLRKREQNVRGPKGRLRSPFHLKEWKPPDRYRTHEMYGLWFRHQTGHRFAREITEGLRKAP